MKFSLNDNELGQFKIEINEYNNDLFGQIIIEAFKENKYISTHFRYPGFDGDKWPLHGDEFIFPLSKIFDILNKLKKNKAFI